MKRTPLRRRNPERPSVLLRLDPDQLKALEAKATKAHRSREAYLRELIARDTGVRSKIYGQGIAVW